VLERLDLASTTLVVVTSDHGEEFFEHGRFGHRKTLYEESIRVPLVVRYPERVPAGRRVSAGVSTMGSPRTLKDVLTTSAQPVCRSKARISAS